MRRAALALAMLAACGDDGGGPVDAGPDAPPDAASCACTYGPATAAGTITLGAADEISGIAASRTIANAVWAHNDSGDTARLFSFGTNAATRGIATLAGATANDWEDIATAPCGNRSCIYVGDIGDNTLARPTVQIFEIDEPAALSGTMDVTYRVFDVAYPDGPHNAEALFVDPRDGASYAITKQATNPSTVFRMPRTMGATATAVSAGTITIPNGNLLVTGADLHTDACGTKLLVRTYDALYELRGAADATIAQLLAATPVKVPVANELQGEAVTYLPDGRAYLTVSEEPNGAMPVFMRVACK